MAVTPCKSCNAPVESNAKACSNCGEEYPGVNKGQQLKLIITIGLGLLLFTLYMGWQRDAAPPATTVSAPAPVAEQPAPQKLVRDVLKSQSLGMTHEQYRDRLNALLIESASPYRVENESVHDVYDGLLWKAKLGDFVTVTARASHNTQLILDVAVYASGNDTRESGQQIQDLASIALAAASTEADYREFPKQFEQMVKGTPYSVDAVKFEAGMAGLLGVWFRATPQ
ncbi:hypothetical protein [Pseudomonas sp. UM16]|uniref:hypothetical protein n=1 Tax=Pseudomonas sp. UM16 TaxID=3158962 RepID=UPI0039900790